MNCKNWIGSRDYKRLWCSFANRDGWRSLICKENTLWIMKFKMPVEGGWTFWKVTFLDSQKYLFAVLNNVFSSAFSYICLLSVTKCLLSAKELRNSPASLWTEVETLVQSNNAKGGLMRRWLQKNFQSTMSSQKSNRKKRDVSLLDLTPKELPFLHDTSLQKFQDFLHSPIPLTRSYIVLQYHWATLCMWEIVGPQFPLWLCDGDYKSHSVSTS